MSTESAVLTLPDADRRWDSVRLAGDWVGDGGRDYAWSDGIWSLELPRPQAARLEYQLSVRCGGQEQRIADPTNPRRVANPFGEKSELRFPGYREPAWLGTPPDGTVRTITPPGVEPSGGVDRLHVPARLWSPSGLAADAPAPLLVVHDGSDMVDRGGLLSWATAYNRVAPLRVVLLDPAPGRRQDWYAAAPDYADHLAGVVLPAVTSVVACDRVVGLGASLGALALLYLHRRHPTVLDAVALQSGSFFTRELDAQESSWEPFERICTQVQRMSAPAGPGGRVIPVVMTCGAVEENLANNRAMAAALTEQGYPVRFVVNPDAHTVIGWRDTWFPVLDDLLTGRT